MFARAVRCGTDILYRIALWLRSEASSVSMARCFNGHLCAARNTLLLNDGTRMPRVAIDHADAQRGSIAAVSQVTVQLTDTDRGSTSGPQWALRWLRSYSPDTVSFVSHMRTSIM